MEVTLNHNIRQFFLLAPDAERADREDIRSPHLMDFRYAGGEIDTEFDSKSCMQLNFSFISNGSVNENRGQMQD